MSRIPNPEPDGRVCLNCRFKMPLIGGIRGWLCREPLAGKRGILLIPSGFYSSEHFEPRRETPPQSLMMADDQVSRRS